MRAGVAGWQDRRLRGNFMRQSLDEYVPRLRYLVVRNQNEWVIQFDGEEFGPYKADGRPCSLQSTPPTNLASRTSRLKCCWWVTLAKRSPRGFTDSPLIRRHSDPESSLFAQRSQALLGAAEVSWRLAATIAHRAPRDSSGFRKDGGRFPCIFARCTRHSS